MQLSERDSPRRGLALVGLLALVALAAAMRTWALDAVPPGFHYDEAYEALEAWRLLTVPGYHPVFFAGNYGVEPLFIYLTSLAFRLMGQTPVAMRSVAAVLGTLTVPALWGLAREMRRTDETLPPALPWLAALVLAILPWHILFSRVGIEPVLVPLDLVLMLWAFWYALRTRSRMAWAGCGLAAGLGPYTYPAGRLLLPLLVALVALVGLLDRPRLRGQGRGLVLAGAVALITLMPLAYHFARHPDQLVLRSSQVAVAPGAAPVGTAAAQPAGGVGENTLAVLGMFSLRGDADPRNNLPGAPVLNPLLSLAFLLGILLAIRRAHRPVYAAVLLAGVAMLLPTLLSEYAPHFRRALGSAPMVALLCGLGLAWPLEWVTGRRRLALGLGVALFLLFSAGLAVRQYFVLWAADPALYYAYDEGLWQIGNYLRERPAGELRYISPRPATDATLAFALRASGPVNHFDGRRSFLAPAFSPLAGAAATYVIIEHEDTLGRALLHELYPQAVEDRVFLDREGKVYARAYRVPVAGAPTREPQEPVAAAWPGIRLVGRDISQAVFRAGDSVFLQLWWQSTAPVRSNWTVFTHLVPVVQNGAGDPPAPLAADDAQPGRGSAPTSSWQPGDLILDGHRLEIPDNVPPGRYRLEVGLYDAAAGNLRNQLTDPPGQDHIGVADIEIR